MERVTGVKQIVIDDLKKTLLPGIFDEDPETLKKKKKKLMKGRQTNKNRKSHFFRSVSRCNGERHKNYLNLPESIGMIDTYQKMAEVVVPQK